MIVTTQFLVLEKRPYRESALIIRGVSPDCGRASFVVHGAQKIGEKKTPVVDLYRELNLEYKDDAPGDLHNADRVELLNDFSSLADRQLNFKMAVKIGHFLLRNTPENVPQPYTYDAASSVYRHLAAPDGEEGRWSLVQCAVVLKCAYLYENGLLPEGGTQEQNDFLENLVASGIDGSPLPACRPEYWNSLNNWMNSLLEFHHLER
ncbi:MAG: recombination protein O N-terminal domain-containing protein [Lentisphaeria bacterium]|nr:recombination protein O N-terminal domain-containing protein [Lentisphaeria bacterium]